MLLDLPAHLNDVANTDKVGRLYNVLRKEFGFLPSPSFGRQLRREEWRLRIFRGLFTVETGHPGDV